MLAHLGIPEETKAYISAHLSFSSKHEEGGEVGDADLEDDSSQLEVLRLGCVLRKGEGRVSGLVADLSGRVVICHGTDPTLEVFVICTEEEVAKRLAKKAKKEKKRTGEEVEVK